MSNIRIVTKPEQKSDKPTKKELKPMPAVVHKKKPAFEKIRKSYEVRLRIKT
jgi:hypothetical protein